MSSAEHVTPVEMNNADSPSETPKELDKKDVDNLSIQDIREHTRQIEKAVQTNEPRFILRVLRALPNTRRKLNPEVLRGVIFGFYTHSNTERDALLNFVEEPMEESISVRIRTGKSSNIPLLSEIDAYLHLLVLIKLIDGGKFNEAVKCSDALMIKVIAQNRRTLDLVAAKCYFYHSRAYELTNQLDKLRWMLHTSLITATLRNDFEAQAVLINCLLRNYLHYNLYDPAKRLVSKSVFPETASNNEWARFLYYVGCIKAARQAYFAAYHLLDQALRKVSQSTAVGFQQTVQKLAVTVELLLGDIPDRQIFRQATLRRSLAPYFQLTQAVRMGNLQKFREVLEHFGPQFRADNTFTLVCRLRLNVIKTGIRSIGSSYLRITSARIAQKLALDSPEDAEFIVAEAIRDGVIKATLDPERGYMLSKEATYVYHTREPIVAFYERIMFCLSLQNQCVKAMRYPPMSNGKDLESAEDRREREQ